MDYVRLSAANSLFHYGFLNYRLCTRMKVPQAQAIAKETSPVVATFVLGKASYSFRRAGLS